MTARRDGEVPSLLLLAPFLSRRYSGTAHAAINVARALAERDGFTLAVAAFEIDDDAIPATVRRHVLPPLRQRRGLWRVGRAFSIPDHQQVLRSAGLGHATLMYTPSLDMALAYRGLAPRARIVTHLGHVIGAREALTDSSLQRPWRGIDARVMDRLERRCYAMRNAEHIVSAGLVARQREAHFGLPADFFTVRPLGIDIGRFSDRSARAPMRARLGVDAEACVIVSVSRLVAWKQTAWVIRALQSLPAHCRLVIVGDGPLRGELEESVPQELCARVTFTGHVDPQPWLAAADVFALPSAIESFGVAYAEALCMGLPCIGLRNQPPASLSAAQEVILDRVNGFVVSDEAELAARLALLATDRHRRMAMSSQAHAHAVASFSQQRYAGYIESRLHAAAGRRAPAAAVR